MNVITLNNDQLAHVRSTLQKQANDLMGDMNAAGQSNWSDLLTAVSYTHLTLPTIYSV